MDPRGSAEILLVFEPGDLSSIGCRCSLPMDGWYWVPVLERVGIGGYALRLAECPLSWPDPPRAAPS